MFQSIRNKSNAHKLSVVDRRSRVNDSSIQESIDGYYDEHDQDHENKMQEMKKMAILKAKDGLHNRWGFMIILACMINITTGS